MKISGGSPLKGMGGEGQGKERRGARLDILSRGPRVPSYATDEDISHVAWLYELRQINVSGISILSQNIDVVESVRDLDVVIDN